MNLFRTKKPERKNSKVDTPAAPAAKAATAPKAAAAPPAAAPSAGNAKPAAGGEDLCFVSGEPIRKGFVTLDIPDDDGNDFQVKVNKEHFKCAYDGKPIDGAYIVHEGKVYSEDNEHHLYPDCGGCQEPIPFGSAMVKALDELWHESCFVCNVCKKPPAGAGGGVEFHHKKKKVGEKTFITVWCPKCWKTLDPKDKEAGDQFTLDAEAVKAKAERDRLNQLSARERIAKEEADKEAARLAAAAAKEAAEKKAKADKEAAVQQVKIDAAAQKEKEAQKAKEKEAQLVEQKAAEKYAQQKAADEEAKKTAAAAVVAAAAAAGSATAAGGADATEGEGGEKNPAQRGGDRKDTYHEWGKVKKTQVEIDNAKIQEEQERIAEEEKQQAKALLEGAPVPHESAKEARIRRQGERTGGVSGNTRVARGTRKNIRRGMTAGADMLDGIDEEDASPSNRKDTVF